MLHTFGKRKDDDVSQYEIKAYLKRGQAAFLDQECQDLFSSIDPNNKGTITVSNFLKFVQDREFKGKMDDSNIRMHDMLRLKVAKEREKIEENMVITDSDKVKDMEFVAQEAELYRNAIGIRTVDPTITMEEFDVTLRQTFQEALKGPIDSEIALHARTLKHGNVALTVSICMYKCIQASNI